MNRVIMLDFPTAWSPKKTSLCFAKTDIAAICLLIQIVVLYVIFLLFPFVNRD